MTARFQQLIAVGAARVGSADAYDSWAQQEQARVLIEYAQRQLPQAMAPGARPAQLEGRMQ
jgi:hypothetical protein